MKRITNKICAVLLSGIFMALASSMAASLICEIFSSTVNVVTFLLQPAYNFNPIASLT